MIFCISHENCNGSDNRGVDMRSENEMYNLILEVAKNNVRVKAVYMNGSMYINYQRMDD